LEADVLDLTVPLDARRVHCSFIMFPKIGTFQSNNYLNLFFQNTYYDGEEPDRHFVVDMLNLLSYYHLRNTSIFKEVMKMTPSDWFDFVNSTVCVICKLPLDDFDLNDSSLFQDDGFVLPKQINEVYEA